MLEEKLKKIRAQIKFGRAVEATQALEALINDASTGELQLLLPVYVDVLMKRQRFREAEGAIERALLIGASDEAHSLHEKLEQCRRELGKIVQVANYDAPLFKQFIEGIPEIFRTGSRSAIEPNFTDVPRLEDVDRFAHDQNIGAPYYSWNAARTQAAKEVYSYRYSEKIDVSRFDNEFSAAIETMCREHLPESAMLYFDDVYGDLVEIARGLLVGVHPPLHHVMMSAYEAHLFPCGWVGNYPAGQLLVHRLW
ncbi:hypothetical protein WT19_13355 [Burkholderia stagnalis]|uniref:Uncharacterized protein n=1 Tax=Burkholderia stagnalis TaxID=1503054 RepID=A0A6L3MNQ7_9BURK|nr:hypothetical protein [Burkholderia stagnalis]KAB0633552.1 hypothetical protein F7R25_29455 [Burkholderia stagnalis]KVO37704.1 hypothetical protein WT17_24020 [Burkholderia stagnalis]KVO74158.1 hypothetical protein WT19_13355 [Burkholderia stagnalis]KVW64266.1 hypothetical protein WT28_00150 [Burkholderia stagnalis]KVX71329.1 hypothetical protein WT34_21255 [Burkholderia stagnalis]